MQSTVKLIKRFTTDGVYYLLALNNTPSFWISLINKHSARNLKTVVLLQSVYTPQTLIKQTFKELVLNKLNPIIKTKKQLLAAKPTQGFVDLSLTLNAVHQRYKTNQQKQIKFITDLIAEIVAIDAKKRILVIAYDVYYPVTKLPRFNNTLFNALLKYGNVLFNLFDVVYVIHTEIIHDTLQLRIYQFKDSLEAEIDLNRLTQIFRTLYDLHKQNVKPFEIEDEETEADSEKHKNTRIKDTVKYLYYNKVLFARSDSPVKINAGEIKIPENKSWIDDYKLELVKTPDFVNALTQEKLPKPTIQQDFEQLVVVLKEVAELKGLKVTKIEFEDDKYLTATRDTLTRRIKLHVLIPPHNIEDVLEIDIPLLIDNYYHLVNGARRILNYQIINKPIELVAPRTVLIHTHRQAQKIRVLENNTVRWYTIGLELSPVIVFAIHGRLDKFAKLFGVTYTIKNKTD